MLLTRQDETSNYIINSWHLVTTNNVISVMVSTTQVKTARSATWAEAHRYMPHELKGTVTCYTSWMALWHATRAEGHRDMPHELKGTVTCHTSWRARCEICISTPTSAIGITPCDRAAWFLQLKQKYPILHCMWRWLRVSWRTTTLPSEADMYILTQTRLLKNTDSWVMTAGQQSTWIKKWQTYIT